MITCYILDDEKRGMEALCSLILKIPELKVTGYQTDALIALNEINSAVNPDILFVDVEMPDLSGIEFRSLIQTKTEVIFVSGDSSYAMKAFEDDVFDYLLKPVGFDRLFKVINKYKKRNSLRSVKDPFFFIQTDVKSKMVRINPLEITYIEGALNYVILHMLDGKSHITYLTLSEIFSSLFKDVFFRIHKSFIVNNNMISSISRNHIVLQDNTIINIGSSYKDQFFLTMNQKLLKTKRNF